MSLQNYSVDQIAGAIVLTLGAIGGLLAIIFKSRCLCKFRIGFTDDCNICMCERHPPPKDSDDEGPIPTTSKEGEEEKETIIPDEIPDIELQKVKFKEEKELEYPSPSP